MWSEKLQELHPGLMIQSEGQGSTTAVPALLEGRSQLGPMSRTFKASELEAFEKSKGYRPTAVRVAVDALAVFVNKENPLEEITLEQLDAVWGKERRRGHADIRRWGDLGLKGAWADKAIFLSGRNSASGTYGFFMDRALLNGHFKDEVRETPSGSPIMTVAVDPHAMAYSGAFYATKAVKALRLAPKAGEKAVAATPENALEGRYPLSRFLLIAVDKPPGKPLPPAVREFLRFALSKEGQEIVVKDGYFPLSEKLAAEERKKLE
jgi:phosphate transport system substrate-binding protein